MCRHMISVQMYDVSAIVESFYLTERMLSLLCICSFYKYHAF